MTVHVMTEDLALRQALTGRLERVEGITVDHGSLEGETRGKVIVTTAADFGHERCAQLAKDGARVIVLAPVTRERERMDFLNSGAFAYVAMTVDAGLLVAAIRAAEAALGAANKR
jgi:DNA-binding response OmpR family regulator